MSIFGFFPFIQTFVGVVDIARLEDFLTTLRMNIFFMPFRVKSVMHKSVCLILIGRCTESPANPITVGGDAKEAAFVAQVFPSLFLLHPSIFFYLNSLPSPIPPPIYTPAKQTIFRLTGVLFRLPGVLFWLTGVQFKHYFGLPLNNGLH